MSHVSVIIDGKTYRMACDQGQDDHLRNLAAKVDGSIQTLRTEFGEIGDQRLAIMAGIMVADELSEVQHHLKGLQAEVISLKESRGALQERYQSTEDDLSATLGELAKRIETIADKLKQNEISQTSQKSAAE